MTDIAALLGLLLSRDDVHMAAVAQFMTEDLKADGSLVLLIDDDGKELIVGAADPPGGPDESLMRIAVGFGVTGLVALSGHGVTLEHDSPRNAAHRSLLGLGREGAVSRLCVPIRGLAGTIVGVISVHRLDLTPFTEADLVRAQVRADLIGLRLYAQGLLGAAEEQRGQRDRLIAHAISAQEAERRRIAGDLHDGVTQALASLAFHLSAADLRLAGGNPVDEEALKQVREARRLAGLAYDETRVAITGLHSLLLEDLGLVAALESLAQTVPGLPVDFTSDALAEFETVPDHVAAVLYRIAQEATNNVVKHAQATQVTMSLRRVGDAVVLGITDDGVGFDVDLLRNPDVRGGHFGLSSIAERCALIGATLRLDSIAGKGTALIVEAPMTTE